MKIQNKKNKYLTALSLLFLTMSVAACNQSVKKTLGFTKRAPDEFRIVSSPPLVVPPEFTLRPPEPGAKGPDIASTENKAKEVIFETTSNVYESSLPSNGESVLLEKAEVQDTNPRIRKILEEEEKQKTAAKEEQGFFDKVLQKTSFLNETKDPLVDAASEKKRIIKKQQEGEVIAGDETPTIEQETPSVLNKVLGL